MNSTKLIIAAKVVLLLATSFTAIDLSVEHRAQAQQPQPSPTPIEYKLNPDASKVWVNIDQAEAELRRQYDQLEGQRATLLIGAGVPQDSRQCKADPAGIVVCVKPSPTPEKK